MASRRAVADALVARKPTTVPRVTSAPVATPLGKAPLSAPNTELVLARWTAPAGPVDPPAYIAPLHIHHEDERLIAALHELTDRGDAAMAPVFAAHASELIGWPAPAEPLHREPVPHPGIGDDQPTA